VRAVVTGGAGFLGSHLVDALIARGDEVVVVDNMRRGRTDNLRRHLASSRFHFLEGDIRDEGLMAAALTGAGLVYHLAAQSNVMGAHDDVDYSFTTNVGGTVTVLKSMAAAGVKRMIFASSREVYGEQQALPVREDAALNAKNLYGASKLSAESYCRAWTNALGVECIVLRFANVYGQRDSQRVIPLWLEQAQRGHDLTLFGGEQVLDFVWIGTAVQALLAAAECPADGPINVGSGKGTRLPDLAQMIKDLTGSRSEIRIAPARGAEVVRFVAHVEKMQAMLGVAPAAEALEQLPLMLRQDDGGAA
jgi:UDP-glucose 4-epimerase